MRYQQFAIVIAAAGLSASTFTISQHPRLQLALGFALSAVLCWLGVLYYWEHVEIHVVAGYLQRVVREKVRMATHMDTWWEWEEYKGAQWKRLGTPNLFRVAFVVLLSHRTFVCCDFAGSSLATPRRSSQRQVHRLDQRLLFLGSLVLILRLLFLILFRSRLSEKLLGRPDA
jgi:hypothetical protein